MDGVVVKDSLGKIRTYDKYKARALKKKKVYTKLSNLYVKASKGKSTEAIAGFIAYFEAM